MDYMLRDNGVMMQYTLSIIKPDAVRRHLIGAIYQRLELSGFKIVSAKMVMLTEAQASEFYIEHKGKPFFEKLVQIMTSGPVMLQVLEGENIISRYRELMGNTDPKCAAMGTLRHDYGINKRYNSVHGSDSIESAKREISFFFKPTELIINQ